LPLPRKTSIAPGYVGASITNHIPWFNDFYVAALRESALLEFDLETGEQRKVISGSG
jgi:hypothetical protein